MKSQNLIQTQQKYAVQTVQTRINILDIKMIKKRITIYSLHNKLRTIRVIRID